MTENRFNNSSYLDKKSGMQIIVNAMNGNEVLLLFRNTEAAEQNWLIFDLFIFEELEVLSDDNFSTLGSPKSRAESAGSKTNLHYPASKTCCSLM